ncbi:immunoglobulin kappa light chain-like [Gouania willdenowi]|uniref:Immunoglobulin kappa light chain-like n=1 Tax=Gouania willdenowi TaxID=441366 RepID=A0A8C5HIL9_GOUWI|nr:immunoglobulin kappa light chain-like [Gouania willdenowi]XP_028329922.1 immunoglobulin kappa light chain-like [Gouania willdenowi]
MTCAHFVLSLICLLSIAQETCQSLSSSLYQERRLISVNVGDSVTLQCFYDDDKLSMFFWYKQCLRQEPKIMSIHHSYDRKGTFHEDFKDKKRFTLKNENQSLILYISDVQVSDSATYYCAKSMHSFSLEFSEGTTVFVKDAKSLFNALVQQSDSETIHPGDSVTLNCTASTGSCDGEPSVYWFKNSEEHHPSLIYTQSDKNVSQCERKTNKTHTCVSNLSLKNLNQSNAGTYYCAVTVCGRIVFGIGTKLELKDDSSYSVLAYVLGGALIITLVISILLIILMYKMLKANSSRSSALPATDTEGINQSSDNLTYATPIVSSFTRSQTRRQEECVYSHVKM